MQISFNIEKEDYKAFVSEVGYGNASKVLRNFIKSYSATETLNERTLRKKLEILEPKFNEMKSEYTKLKESLEKITDKKKQKELGAILELEKQKQKANKIEGETLKTFLYRAL